MSKTAEAKYKNIEIISSSFLDYNNFDSIRKWQVTAIDQRILKNPLLPKRGEEENRGTQIAHIIISKLSKNTCGLLCV
jgi:hypothetical protein